MVTRSGSDGLPLSAGPGADALHGSGEGEVDRRWRRVLWALPTGLYVLGSSSGGHRNLMTISWVTQVATEPRQVGVGIERKAVTMELVRTGGRFALSMLGVEDRSLVRRFAKPVPADEVVVDAEGTGTMRGEGVHAAVTGAPVLDRAVAYLDCQVVHVLDLQSHCWVVGTVVDAGFGADGEGAAILTMGDTRMNYGG